MTELPLFSLRDDPAINRRDGLRETIQRLDRAQFIEAFHQTAAQVTSRADRKKRFFKPRDGKGGATKLTDEPVVAKAIFNSQPITLNGAILEIKSYQAPTEPTRGQRIPKAIDLVGWDDVRLWIIELKTEGNSSTPLYALVEALCYAAIWFADPVAVRRDAEDILGVDSAWPPAIAVAADSAYWCSWPSDPTESAGSWLPALRELGGELGAALETQIPLLDLGELTVVRGEERVHLAEPITATML